VESAFIPEIAAITDETSSPGRGVDIASRQINPKEILGHQPAKIFSS